MVAFIGQHRETYGVEPICALLPIAPSTYFLRKTQQEPNANVYFEVGYALALKKPIILLAKRDTKLPFDIAGFRVLFYDDSIGGKTRVEEGLTQHLTAILGAEQGQHGRILG